LPKPGGLHSAKCEVAQVCSAVGPLWDVDWVDRIGEAAKWRARLGTCIERRQFCVLSVLGLQNGKVNVTLLSLTTDRCRVVSDAAMLGAVTSFAFVRLSRWLEVFLVRFACPHAHPHLPPLMTALPQRHAHKNAPDEVGERYYGV
jgi:hypothetical protein